MPMQSPIDPADHPSGKVNGPPTRATIPAFVFAKEPDGPVHTIAAQNARDWERRGKGWVILGPAKNAKDVWNADKTPVEASVVEDALPKTEPAPAPEAAATPEDRAAIDALTALRDEAAALGIPVDQRWGRKRLTAEIANARG